MWGPENNCSLPTRRELSMFVLLGAKEVMVGKYKKTTTHYYSQGLGAGSTGASVALGGGATLVG